MIKNLLGNRQFYRIHPQKLPLSQQETQHYFALLEPESFDFFVYDSYNEIIIDAPLGYIRFDIGSRLAQELNLIELDELTGIIHYAPNQQASLKLFQGCPTAPDKEWTIPIYPELAEEILEAAGDKKCLFTEQKLQYAGKEWCLLQGMKQYKGLDFAYPACETTRPAALPVWVNKNKKICNFNLLNLFMGEEKPQPKASYPRPQP